MYGYDGYVYSYYVSDFGQSVDLSAFNLTSIQHPTGGNTNFSYASGKNSVAERYDSVPTTIVSSTGTVPQTNIENKATFVYTPYNATTKRYGDHKDYGQTDR